MKVVQINAVYGVMSTGRNVKEIYDFLLMHGHDCIVFYGELKGNYGDNVKFMGSDFSHKMHAIESRITGNAGHGSTQATRKVLKSLDEYKPDVVHLNNLHGNFINIKLLLQYLANKDIATVVHLHDCFFFTGGCMHYTTNKCYKWHSECKDCRFLKRWKNFIISNPAKRNLEDKIRLFSAIPRLAVCGVSKWITSQAQQSPAFKHAKIITNVYNWIDLEVFKPQTDETNIATKQELGIKNKQMLLGVASGWSREKGLDDFIKLAEKIADNQVIVLVGKMPPGIKLPNNILHLDATDNLSGLSKLYSAADIFVHLSKEETFGKVIAEALACGTPAIVYDSTAMPEIVDKKTGIVISQGDITSIAHNISYLSSKNLQTECRLRAEKYFGKTNNCSRILEIYNQLL